MYIPIIERIPGAKKCHQNTKSPKKAPNALKFFWCNLVFWCFGGKKLFLVFFKD